MAALTLISLNIEGRRHIERIVPFLRERQPDVLCVQELNEHDIALIEEVLGARCTYAPMVCDDEDGGNSGIGIFTSLPARVRTHRYAGHTGELMKADQTSPETQYQTQRYILLIAVVTKDDQTFTIGTTHLPVTESGAVTDFQREALDGLLTALEQYPEIVLCGDMNAPRGRETFDTLAARYTDNIPPEYTTSIDGDLHRAGPIPFMVDGLFTTPAYTATDVALHCGVSDHCAITAQIQRIDTQD